MQLFIIVINVRSQSGIYQSLSIIIILMDYLLDCLLIVDNRFNKLKQQGPLYFIIAQLLLLSINGPHANTRYPRIIVSRLYLY